MMPFANQQQPHPKVSKKPAKKKPKARKITISKKTNPSIEFEEEIDTLNAQIGVTDVKLEEIDDSVVIW